MRGRQDMQRILVVDDMATNRELLREILEDDYSIETAENGENALIRLEEYREELAAVLLDLQMPELDGFAVIDAMKKNGLLKKIPVLIISSEHAVQVESQCLELGVSDFIHKPFDGSIVRNRVKNTLELFAYKNRLEQTVEKQRKTLRHQDRIIQIQAERLKEAEPFDRLMMEYRFAIMEVETRLKVLNEEFSREYKRNPIESIRSRLKTGKHLRQDAEKGLSHHGREYQGTTDRRGGTAGYLLFSRRYLPPCGAFYQTGGHPSSAQKGLYQKPEG